MVKLSRRHFLETALLGTVAVAAVPACRASDAPRTRLRPTPAEIEGPFYPVVAQKDKDFDLTLVEGRTERARGEVVVIEGRVLGVDGEPIENATVDLWQANAAGRYRHPHDPSRSPLDPNFQGWAIVPSGTDGGFRFKTVMPGSYPAARDWMRPSHIHFKVSKRGYVELVTQMYFPGHELNEVDRLLQSKSSKEQEQMIAVRDSGARDRRYRYDIVLAEA